MKRKPTLTDVTGGITHGPRLAPHHVHPPNRVIAQKEAVHTDWFETQEACVAAAQQAQFELGARIRWSCIRRGGREQLLKQRQHK